MPKIEHKLIPKKLHKLIQIDYPITEDGYYEYVLDRDKFQDKLLRYINETFPDVEVMSQTQHYFEDTQDKYFNFGFAGEFCTLLFDYYATFSLWATAKSSMWRISPILVVVSGLPPW